jgi:hypothetical protein
MKNSLVVIYHNMLVEKERKEKNERKKAGSRKRMKKYDSHMVIIYITYTE